MCEIIKWIRQLQLLDIATLTSSIKSYEQRANEAISATSFKLQYASHKRNQKLSLNVDTKTNLN